MPDLCTVAQVKQLMETSTTATDALIASYITSATAEIERRYQRQFGPYGVSTKTFEVHGSVIDLAPYDLQAIPTTVTLRSPEQSVTNALTSLVDYQVLPVGGWIGMSTYTQIRMNRNIIWSGFAIQYGYAELVVNGTWGAAAVPTDVADAAAKTVASWLDRNLEGYGLQDLNQATGQDVRPDKFGGWSIPAQAHRILWPYNRDYSFMVSS